MEISKKGLLCFIILATMFISSLIPGVISTATAADYNWKIQSVWGRGDLSMELLKEFAATADKLSKGRIKIQVFADPELVPGEQLFEATKKGTLTMAWTGGRDLGAVAAHPESRRWTSATAPDTPNSASESFRSTDCPALENRRTPTPATTAARCPTKCGRSLLN